MSRKVQTTAIPLGIRRICNAADRSSNVLTTRHPQFRWVYVAAALPRVAMAALVLLLGGCAIWPLGGANKVVDVNTDEPALVRVYELHIDAPETLAGFLFKYLDLARFQQAPERDGVSRSELARLIAAAPAQAKALLETQGYFNAQVQAQQRSADAGLPQVLLTILPGPRARVESLALDVQGPLRESLQQADRASIATWGALHRDWLLRPDTEFRQSQWSAAKAAMLDRLRTDGYPAASWIKTEARIDAQTNTAALDITADSGPLYHLGSLRIEGLRLHEESSVRNAANFQPGTVYSERLLIDYAERLRALNLFESSVVELDASSNEATAAAVVVRVRELPLQQATVGLGYGDSIGPRITLEHTHRRVLGQAWVAKNKVEWGRDRRVLESELLSHPIERGYRNLVAANASRDEEVQSTTLEASRLRVGRSLDTEKIERLGFVEALSARTRRTAGRAQAFGTNHRALSANFHWLWRDLDNVLLPTLGTAWNLQAALGQASSHTAQDGPFGRFYARFSGYFPVGKVWHGSARVEAAQLFAGSSVGLADPLLFRAGGDESVRGYAHRSLGPVKDGLVSSGRALFTSSLELARPVSRELPTLWWAAFLDAGQAAQRWRQLRPVFGYGVGVRWRSPAGPLRLDLAYGEALNKARLHLSVGIAF
jgi:translocation and assembly module TamA